MAGIRKFIQFAQKAKFINKCYHVNEIGNLRSFCTMVQQPQKTQNIMRIGLIGAVTGIVTGGGYAYYKISETRTNTSLVGTQEEAILLEDKPSITPSRKVLLQ